jgi:hypothetical protein
MGPILLPVTTIEIRTRNGMIVRTTTSRIKIVTTLVTTTIDNANGNNSSSKIPLT